ncbi:MAG: hypothetical protein ACLTF5_07735 [Butyricicoccus sp.]
MDRNKAEKRMATAPVGRLMLQMGTPMILSMMLQAVYNIVDSYFVANMAENGEIAVNALTLVSGADDDGRRRHRHRCWRKCAHRTRTRSG